MSARRPKGFTIIEVLVVITIIGVLIGLLIPAILSSRESARRTQCTNNQHEIAVALKQYETTADRLPGFVNSLGGTANGLTWIAMLCPHMGMNDVWAILRQKQITVDTSIPDLPSLVPGFLCPSDGNKRNTRFPLSYVGNCGWYNHDDPSFDVLQAIFTGTAASAGIAVRTDEIPDGAQNTLMFSENINATQWFTLTTAEGSPPAVCRLPLVVDVGMLWCNPLDNNAINARLNDPTLPTFPATDEAALLYMSYARPSSYHPDGIVATFCDGHTEFINNSITPLVYQQRMSPDDAQAKSHDPPLMP